MDSCVEVGGDDDTSPGTCLLCTARANVDAALVRAGVEQLTVVVSYARPPLGRSAVESARAILTMPQGIFARGEGHSREEAIFNALDNAGVAV